MTSRNPRPRGRPRRDGRRSPRAARMAGPANNPNTLAATAAPPTLGELKQALGHVIVAQREWGVAMDRLLSAAQPIEPAAAAEMERAMDAVWSAILDAKAAAEMNSAVALRAALAGIERERVFLASLNAANETESHRWSN